MRRPKSRLIAAPPISTGNSSPRSCSSWTQAGICLEVETSSAERPIASAFSSTRGVDDRVDRDLLAEVDDRVAVVGEDRVDQRLADVVDVAEDGRDHDLALGVALDPLEVVLELRDGALHHLGRLQDEGQDQLAGAELVADLLHRRQQHLVQGGDGADLLDRAVDPVLDPVLLAVEDLPVEGLLGLHALGRVAGGLLGLLALLLEVGDELLQRVLGAVEDQVVGQLALLLGDLHIWGDVVRVDHRQVEPGLDAVVQEDRVEDRAGAAARRRRRRSRRPATSSRGGSRP